MVGLRCEGYGWLVEISFAMVIAIGLNGGCLLFTQHKIRFKMEIKLILHTRFIQKPN